MRKWTDEEVHKYRKEHHQQVLYFNPKDARIFVPKYIGVGWTLNFGHVITFIIGILIIISIIFAILQSI